MTDATSENRNQLNSTIKTVYDDQGFVIVPGLIPPQNWAELEAACQRTVQKVRDGTWPHRRTVGRQFPPFNNDNPDSWGVQHIMHPQLSEPAFGQWYTSDKLLEVVKELLDCKDHELQLEMIFMKMLLRKKNEMPFEHGVMACSGTRASGRVILLPFSDPFYSALYTDSCLYILPHSHKTVRTPEQRRLSETLDPPQNPLTMPGAICLTLQPGETVFYNSNILHCAAYNLKVQRATLHGCVGDVRGGSIRARNVLQHDLEWMKGDEFRVSLPDNLKTRKMLDNFLNMQRNCRQIDYSLQN